MAVGLVAGGAALAHSGAMGVVKERMDAMGEMGRALKALTAETRSGAPDLAAVRASGAVIAEHGGAAMVTLFPDGSDGGVSEALPAIWSDAAGFAALADKLKAQGEALAGAGSAEGLAEAVQAVARVCAECHEGYRLKK